MHSNNDRGLTSLIVTSREQPVLLLKGSGDRHIKILASAVCIAIYVELHEANFSI